MPTGILLLDKPAGLTSNGALQRVRHALGAKSAGHVGTLDPMATGMLPLCFDEATKVIAEIESGAKCYDFTLQLGRRTDTGDIEGSVVEELAVPPFTQASLEAVLAQFRGVQTQVPPMYSALKRAGRPLYELARQGIEVERAPRSIDIRRLDLVERRADSLDLSCDCGKGTYIRVLGEDIARALGTCGHLIRLRRLWVEPFRGLPMTDFEAALGAAGKPGALLPADAALQHLPRAEVGLEQAAALRHGQAVQTAALLPVGRRIRVYEASGVFMGLAEALEGGRLQPRKLLAPVIA